MFEWLQDIDWSEVAREALHRKVAELEGKLNDSTKKQNMLEEKINQLLTFLKSLFPSFK